MILWITSIHVIMFITSFMYILCHLVVTEVYWPSSVAWRLYISSMMKITTHCFIPTGSILASNSVLYYQNLLFFFLLDHHLSEQKFTTLSLRSLYPKPQPVLFPFKVDIQVHCTNLCSRWIECFSSISTGYISGGCSAVITHILSWLFVRNLEIPPLLSVH